ncbi:MAG: HAD family hydrolase [Bryobacterales bacterium]|nr:HAD family hydrolase [Bryobacterales bacterium]
MRSESTIRLCFSPEVRLSSGGPAVFLDRDGVINRKIPGGYVTDWRHFEFVPGILPAMASLAELGVPVIVISNQACVGKGLLSRRLLSGMTQRFTRFVREGGGRIDAVYYCPHTAESGCGCRKPRPGMLERAARDFAIDLRASVFVGDSPTDVEAAAAVGCASIVLLGQEDSVDAYPPGCAFVRSAGDLPEAVVNALRSRTRESLPAHTGGCTS